jgi:hypothetical protein
MTKAELDKKIEKYIELKELGLNSKTIENEIARQLVLTQVYTIN